MSAGTEGFRQTRGDVNPIGSIVSKILEARKMAEEERTYASKIAEQNQTSLEEAGIERGFFFKKALKWKFGGEFKERKKNQLSNFLKKKDTAKTILTGRGNKTKHSGAERFDMIWSLFEKGSSAPSFRDQFKELYKTEVDDPSVRPQSLLIPGTTKKIQKSTSSSKKRISKEELLKTLTDLVKVLETTAKSLSSSVESSTNGIIKAANAQEKIADELRYRGSTLEDKLDNLIAAISQQTDLKKKERNIQKVAAQEANLEKTTDASSTVAFDNTTTDKNESVAATSSQKIEEQQKQAYEPPVSAESGAVFSGPDSGYKVKDLTLHGDEAIVPLSNAFTNPNKQAVTAKGRELEKKSPKTSMMPQASFEVGTRPTAPSMGGKLGFNITNNIAMGGTTKPSAMSQSMIDVMALPSIATGGYLLAATSNYMNRVGGGDVNFASEIGKLSRPLANVFGLPASIVSKATAGGAAKAATRVPEKTGEEDQGKQKDLLAKMTEGFAKLLENLSKSIQENQNTPNPTTNSQLIPGDAPPEIKALMETISGGEGGPNSVQGIGEVPGLSDMTIDQAIAKAKSYIGKGSETGALGAYQQHSDYLRERAIKAGLDPTKDKFSLENQTQIQRVFMVGLYGQTEETMVRHLKEGKLESHIFPSLSRDAGWPSLPGGSQPNVHTPGAAKRYQQTLLKYQAAAAAPAAQPNAPSVSLGQQITENYGMQTHEKFFFKLGGVEYHAYKTAKGFDFYKGTTKVTDRAEEEKVIKGFKNLKENAIRASQNAQALSAPLRDAARNPRNLDGQEVASAAGTGISVLNIGSGASADTAGTSAQPTENTSRGQVPHGSDPLAGLYTNSQQIMAG